MPRLLRIAFAKQFSPAFSTNIGERGIRRLRVDLDAFNAAAQAFATTLTFAPDLVRVDALFEDWKQSRSEDWLIEIGADATQVQELLIRSLDEQVGDTPAVTSLDADCSVDTPAAIAQQGAARREQLMSEEKWLSSAQVSRSLGSTAENAAKFAMEKRKSGEILGVWHGPRKSFFHPPWQFTSQGPIQGMRELLAVLPEGNKSGWAQAEWLYTPHALLEGRRPADVMIKDPDRVVAVAREEFTENPDARW
jgi:hypothetical protein